MPKETKEELEKIIATLRQELTKTVDPNPDLEYENKQMQEKLYANGIDIRPTIMQKIINREKELFSAINYMLEDCERETGRTIGALYLINSIYIDS